MAVPLSLLNCILTFERQEQLKVQLQFEVVVWTLTELDGQSGFISQEEEDPAELGGSAQHQLQTNLLQVQKDNCWFSQVI